MWGAVPPLPRDNYLEVKVVVSVLWRHDQLQHATELYSVVKALRSWGPGKLLFV